MFVFEKTITISFADFLAFNKIHAKQFRVKPRWLWLIISVLAVFVAVVGETNTDKVHTPAIIISAFILIYAMLTAVIWLSVLLIKLFHRLILFISYKLNSHIFINVNVLINEKGIDYNTGKKQYAALWSQIVKVHDDGLRYFIYYAENAAFILPKHYLGSLDQRQEFVNFLKAYTNTDLKYTAPKDK